MAEVTVEDLAKYLEINPNQDLSEVKKEIDQKFVRADVKVIQEKHPDLYSSIMGKANHAILSKVKNLAQNVGVDVTWSDFEGKQTVEVIEAVNEQIMGKVSGYTTTVQELENQLKEAKKSGASAKDVEALTAELKVERKKNQDTAGLLEETKNTFEQYKNEVANREKEFKINTYKSESYKGLNLKTNSDYERKGFFQDLESKYKLELDGDEVIVRDAEGKRVSNPEKNGTFLSLAEVAALEADKAGLLNKNPHDGKPAGNQKPPAIPAGTETKEVWRPVNPLLRR
jgi:hypothetical protein